MLQMITSLSIPSLVHAYGLWVLFGIVMLESSGVPIPGETALVTASVYAGATHDLMIGEVIGVAALAAVVGDNIGYVVGRTLGLRLLSTYGHYARLTEGRLKIGRYLFLRHGGKIVFFGRFISLLRTFAALLAGANRMEWHRFATMNAAGALVWATLFGGAAYVFGDRLMAVSGLLGAIALGLVVVAAIAGAILFRRFERRFEDRARAAIP